MITVKSRDLWTELEILSKKTSCIKAAVAYVSDDSCVSFGKGDILVVDASDASIAGGRTSARVLSTAHMRGAQLYSCDTLHGKVMIFDHHAYIGSANISKNSVKNLDEIGIITDHPSIISGAIQLVEQLVKQSTEIDKEFIQRILQIDVKHSNIVGSKPRNIHIVNPRTWLVSLRDDAEYPGDESKVERDNVLIETSNNEDPAWFFMKNNNRFYNEAKNGDSVVIIGREKEKSKQPEYANRHIAIKGITIDKAVGTKAYHYAYIKDYEIKWKQFKKLAEKAGVSRLGSGLNTVRELSAKQSNALFELWGA